MKKILWVAFIMCMTLACSSFGRKSKSLSDGQVQYTVILSGPYSGANEYEVKLVTNQREWEQIWQVAKGKEDPLPSIPTVNFNHQYVIAAFMGQRSSSGYKIEISDIQKHGKILKVHIKKYETPGMLTVMTNPFTLIRVPRGDYKLEVTEETIQ
jgi:hypothetical protein